jgi:asparagine synthase (glutamine-hydrolysing)
LRKPEEGWPVTSALGPAFAAEIDATGISGEGNGRFDGMSHDASLRLRYLERMWASRPDADLREHLGFEGRDPLGDIRLIDYCIAIPPDQFMRNGITRSLARRVLADRVPAVVLGENRIGRQTPEWFHRLSHDRQQLVNDLEDLEQSPLARHMLDLPRMKAIAADWPADADAAADKFVPLMAVLARGVNIGQFIQWVEGSKPLPVVAVQ